MQCSDNFTFTKINKFPTKHTCNFLNGLFHFRRYLTPYEYLSLFGLKMNRTLLVLCRATFGLKCYFYIVLGQFQEYSQHFIFVTQIIFISLWTEVLSQQFLFSLNKSLLRVYTYYKQVILQAVRYFGIEANVQHWNNIYIPAVTRCWIKLFYHLRNVHNACWQKKKRIDIRTIFIHSTK